MRAWPRLHLAPAAQPLIPVLLLVLGANLSTTAGSTRRVPARTIAGVVTTKLVLMPALGLAVVLAAQRAGLLGGAAADPLAVLAMLVAWATPTAILVHSLALVHDSGHDEVSALLFWEYVAATATLPLCCASFLTALGCAAPHVA